MRLRQIIVAAALGFSSQATCAAESPFSVECDYSWSRTGDVPGNGTGKTFFTFDLDKSILFTRTLSSEPSVWGSTGDHVVPFGANSKVANSKATETMITILDVHGEQQETETIDRFSLDYKYSWSWGDIHHGRQGKCHPVGLIPIPQRRI